MIRRDGWATLGVVCWWGLAATGCLGGGPRGGGGGGGLDEDAGRDAGRDARSMPEAEVAVTDPCGATDLGSRLGAAVASGRTTGRGAALDTALCGAAMKGVGRGGTAAPEAVLRWVAPAEGRYTFDTLGSSASARS